MTMRLQPFLDEHMTTRRAQSQSVASPKVAATTMPDLTDERGRIMDVLAENVEILQTKYVYAKGRIQSASSKLEPKFAEHLMLENGRCACAVCLAYRVLVGMPEPSSAPLPPDFVSPDAGAEPGSAA